jgi:hypothetical protein
MSFIASLSSLSNLDIERIEATLNIYGEASSYGPPKNIKAYKRLGDEISLPFSFYYSLYNSPSVKYPNATVEHPRKPFEFTGKLRSEQVSVINEAQKILRKKRCIILHLPCNFGKTCLAIYLASRLGFKTGVFVANNLTLLKQWFERINWFAPEAKIQEVTGQTEMLDPEANFHVFTPLTVARKPPEFFRDIGMLIVDEFDRIATSCFSKGLHNVRPKFLIGMSATPDRDDGMEKLLHEFFGYQEIFRSDTRYFEVYRYNTGIIPKYELNVQGKPDWNSVLNSLTYNEVRNRLIISMIQHFDDMVILVLCKRIDHCDILEKMLEAEKESYTSIYGKKKSYDQNARIIIATFPKIGIGIDDQRIRLMILADSVKKIEQYKGRARAQGTFPMVLDIVDHFGPCYKHWNIRYEWYRSHNCKIKYFVEYFPEFEPPEELKNWQNEQLKKCKEKINIENPTPKRLTMSKNAKIKCCK